MKNNNVFYAIYKMIYNDEEKTQIKDEMIQTTFDTLQEVSDYLQTPKSYIKSAITRKQIINNDIMIYRIRED